MSAFKAMVISELKLRDIERKIFAPDFVEGAHDAALQAASEAFDRVGMDAPTLELPQ